VIEKTCQGRCTRFWPENKKSHEGRRYHLLKKPSWLYCTFCKMMDGITPFIHKKTARYYRCALVNPFTMRSQALFHIAHALIIAYIQETTLCQQKIPSCSVEENPLTGML